MPRRLLALVALVVVATLAAGCADDVSPALRVGPTKIGNGDFQAELDEWIGNSVLIDPSTINPGAPGAYPGDLARGLMQQRIDFELNNQEFAKQGLVLDDRMRQDAITAIFQDQASADQQLGGFSKAYGQSVLDDLARSVALNAALGEQGYAAWHADAYANADIEVSPRYGTWDAASGTILPPAAPLSEPAGT